MAQGHLQAVCPMPAARAGTPGAFLPLQQEECRRCLQPGQTPAYVVGQATIRCSEGWRRAGASLRTGRSWKQLRSSCLPSSPHHPASWPAALRTHTRLPSPSSSEGAGADLQDHKGQRAATSCPTTHIAPLLASRIAHQPKCLPVRTLMTKAGIISLATAHTSGQPSWSAMDELRFEGGILLITYRFVLWLLMPGTHGGFPLFECQNMQLIAASLPILVLMQGCLKVHETECLRTNQFGFHD